MKICAAFLIVLALVAGFYTHQNEGQGIWGAAKASTAPEIQKSSRPLKESGGGQHSGSQATPLAELRANWQAILPSRGESLFDEQEVAKFLKTLNLEETRMLAIALVEDQSANKDAASRVIGRWAELDVAGALAFLDEQKYDNGLFRHHLFVGWAKADSKAAFDSANLGELRNPISSRWGSDAELRAPIMESMARSDPESAFRILSDWSLKVFDIDAIDESFTNLERDAIFKGLPSGSNWEMIANRFSKSLFTHPESFPIPETGLGRILFSRWATEDPQKAIAWFRPKHLSAGEIRGPRLPDLVGSWYDSDPDSAGAWIDQLFEKQEHGEFTVDTELTLDLGQQIWSKLPDPRWLARIDHRMRRDLVPGGEV